MSRPEALAPREAGPVPGPGADARVLVGAVAAAHGVRGEVKLKSFTADPLALGAYGPVFTQDGRPLGLSHLRLQGRAVIARVDGVADRDAAEALRGQRLYVERAALPPVEDEDEFYHADLLGLAVVDAAGSSLGTVRAVPNFGGGDLLEIAFDGGSFYLPFTREVVPTVDLKAGRIVAAPPEGWRDQDAAARPEGAA